MRPVLWLMISLPVAGWAQTGPGAVLAGPVSGYVSDSRAQGVRPILGVPGAARVGAVLDLAPDARLLAVAPAQDYFVAAGAGLSVIRAGDLATTRVDTVLSAPDQVLFSASGTALLVSGAASSQVLTGLPGAARAGWSPHAFSLPDAFRPLAVSDDGELLLGSGSTLDSAGLFQVARNGETRLLVAGEGLVAAFAPAAHDVVAASRSSRTVWWIADGAAARVIAGAAQGVTSPVGVAFERQSGRAVVANSGTDEVLLVNVRSGDAARIGCGCRVTTLERVGSMFRLNELTTEPLWLLDARAETARLWFVPPTAGGDNLPW